uniref:protein-tyrosine-phosphatase n=1 Tax=Dermatophagoides pteronyssinus TaxID=6956 RepID=A0A6P6XLC4_DERPT|nr:tyrosine-protein phosphatase non-receptor type 4-like [Dermatophagoides pteronyssinus]
MSRKFISILSGTTYNVHANEIASGMRQQQQQQSSTLQLHPNENDQSSSPSLSSPQSLLSSPNNFGGGGRLSNLSALITGRTIIPVPETIKCIVHFLDDTEHIFEIDRAAKGEELMDAVFRHLELIEREYFALQYTEIFRSTTQSSNVYDQQQQYSNQDNLNVTMNCSPVNTTRTVLYNKWLDPTKKIRKQMRFCQQPYLLHFRVKFYVTEMTRLLEEYTRYHFYLQIRKDILAGHLCQLSSSTLKNDGNNSEQQQQQNEEEQDSIMATLASYVLQSELGDYCEEEHRPGYSNEFRFIPNQTDEFCHKVESLHRLHQGQTPADAEFNYLEEAKHLELYGVDLHNAKDYDNIDIKIGVSSNGLAIYKIILNPNNGQQKYCKINMFSWAKIVKISFKRRYFFIQLKHEGTERFDNLIGFNLCSYRACKSLWKSCVEQHTFFRLHTPKPLTKKFFFFFSLGSKFRYSGKTEFQTIEENRRRLTRTERIFIRNTGRNATMPASIIKSSTPNGNDINNQQQPAKINMDAQKHIVNLKLSTIDSCVTTTTATTVVTNGSMIYTNNKYNDKLRTSSSSRQSHSKQQRKHSTTALSLMESDSLSSSSASSLLGPSSIINEKKAQTLQASTITAKNDTKTVLSSSSSSGHLIHNNNNQKHSKRQSDKKTIIINNKNNNNNNTSHSNNHHSQKFTFISSSSSSSSTSTSSIESSFMPANLIEDQKVEIELENGTNDLIIDDVGQNVCCDNNENATIMNKNIAKDNNDNLKILNSNNDNDQSTTIITIGNDHAKISTITTTTMTTTTFTTTAFTPSTLISLPYIDSISTTSSSDKTINSLTNGTILLGDDNNSKDVTIITETSQTSTITEDIPNDNDTDIESKDQQQQSTFDFDLPIHELIKELYDDAAADMPVNHKNNADDVDCIKDPSSDTDSPIHVVTVTMKPDEQGRFGFNVKGGHDQNCPVLVSRILPNTPADCAEPKLHEGDQVLAINSVEVSGLKHEQVVQLIRSTKDLGPDAKLLLSIRPNVYYKHCQCPNETIDTVDHEQCNPEQQSPFHYTPLNYSVSPSSFIDDINPEESGDDDDDDDGENGMKIEHTSSVGSSLLDTSMNLLHEGLQGDLLIIQFEYLPRRNEDEPITIARLLDNVPKNRYLDIAPYDSTRVIMSECNTGDYINASYVTMKIEASNVVNRYIATQGPLKRTTSDFWQMVWEQRSTLIVMVTPLIEDGRKKCFKYWPDEGQTMIVNDLLDLTLEDCQDRGAFLERRFKLIDPENKNTHYITHLQYLAWPDQGVPDDDTDFLKLIFKVRELRQESSDSPVIVHCSAGIGRTGVLILMETGICLIEANQPVYPLELVRIMRNQRAMLIQTSTQFRFVCEALHRVFRDHIVRPLDQYVIDNKTDDNDDTTNPTELTI